MECKVQRQEEAVLIPNWFDKLSMLQCQISQPASYYTTFFTQTYARTHTHTHNYLLVRRSQIPNRRSAKLFNPTPHNDHIKFITDNNRWDCFLSPLLFSHSLSTYSSAVNLPGMRALIRRTGQSHQWNHTQKERAVKKPSSSSWPNFTQLTP